MAFDIRPEKQILTRRIFLLGFEKEKHSSHQGIQDTKILCFSHLNQLHWFPAFLKYENVLSCWRLFPIHWKNKPLVPTRSHCCQSFSMRWKLLMISKCVTHSVIEQTLASDAQPVPLVGCPSLPVVTACSWEGPVCKHVGQRQMCSVWFLLANTSFGLPLWNLLYCFSPSFITQKKKRLATEFAFQQPELLGHGTHLDLRTSPVFWGSATVTKWLAQVNYEPGSSALSTKDKAIRESSSNTASKMKSPIL